MQNIILIDSHTGGEPTRTVIDVQPSLKALMSVERLRELQSSADWVRRAILLEPRGNESMVGALLGPPPTSHHTASVVFFNNTGYLGMCGHGLIGVVETLRFQNQIGPGDHRFDTPAGDVLATLHDDHSVSFCNVPSYRYLKDVIVRLDGRTPSRFVSGDIAYGGNWFYLVDVDSLEFDQIGSLTEYCSEIREALHHNGITGAQGAAIDHIELCCHGLVDCDGRHLRGSRNFVLCPGGHYDRSPCGTGTSAKVACLAADGELAAGDQWVQESIIGSRFEAHYREVCEPDAYDGCSVIVTVKGRAFVTAQSTCLLDPSDPYCFGIVPPLASSPSSAREVKVTS